MDEKRYLHLSKKMDFKTANVVATFAGWPDAKRVATFAAEYLRDKLKAEKIGKIDPSPFYDFVIERPLVNIKNGLMKDYTPPINELYTAKAKASAQGLLILIGMEPHTSWGKYTESLFQALVSRKVNLICLLGGLVDRIPHTVDPLVSGVASTPKLMTEMRQKGVELAEYSGPSSIHSLVLKESERKRIPAVSIWGHAPEYVNDVDPRTAHQLLSKAKALLNIEVDMEELQMEANLFQKQLDSLMKQDRSFAELVQKLEAEYRNSRRSPGYVA
jgi:proteasome assembly chaperone (PAC2) family protein